MVTLAGWDALCQHSIVDFLVVLTHSSSLPKIKDKKKAGKQYMLIYWKIFAGPNKRDSELYQAHGVTEVGDSRHDTRHWWGGNQFSYSLRMPVGQEEMAAAFPLLSQRKTDEGREIDEWRCASYRFAYGRSFNLHHRQMVCIVYSIERQTEKDL